MKKNICLIGFMGSGKTTIGSVLAERLGWEWIDLDEAIVEGEGMTIPEIFKEKGETFFRDLETKYLQEALAKENVIISTGGGIVVKPHHIALLKMQKTFYLSWEFEALYRHISGDTNRPLVTNYDEILERFNGRKPLYEKASYKTIHCDHKSIDEVANLILQDGNNLQDEKGNNIS